MLSLPVLTNLSHAEKDELIISLWHQAQHFESEVEALRGELEELKNPKKTSKNSSIPASNDKKATKKEATKKPRKKSSTKPVGRKLEANPDQIIVAHAKTCPHCGESVNEAGQHLPALYDKIEIPPVKPIVTRVEPYSGHCPHCAHDYVSPVPTGFESQSPFGTSIQVLATYYRYTHAISYNRLARLFEELYGLHISEGGLANLFQQVKQTLEPRVDLVETPQQPFGL